MFVSTPRDDLRKTLRLPTRLSLPSVVRFPGETRLPRPRSLLLPVRGAQAARGFLAFLVVGPLAAGLGNVPSPHLDCFLTCAEIRIVLLHWEEALYLGEDGWKCGEPSTSVQLRNLWEPTCLSSILSLIHKGVSRVE